MICLLCEPEDDDALWLATALARHGQSVECVLPEDVMLASALTCRLDGSGATSALRLADGRVIEAGLPDLVVNRLVELPTLSGSASAVDRRYLAEEWRAAIAVWLRTLRCPVLNPPRAATVSGPVLPVPAWRAIAHANGCPVPAWDSDEPLAGADPVEVVSVAGRTVDPTASAPAWVPAAMARMSRHVGAPLLGVTLDRCDGQWALLDATTRPPLTPGGGALVTAVLAAAHQSAGAR